MQAVQDFNVSNPEGQQSNITDDQALAVFVATDDGLCQLVASNSGPDGDKALVAAAVAELESRATWRKTLAQCAEIQQELGAIKALASEPDPPRPSRRSFLAGLFGLVGVAALPRSTAVENDRPVTNPVLAHWRAQFDQAIDALTAIRDGIGRPITGQEFYALETDIFNTLGDLVEAMESEPFNDLVVALGIKTDYLAALGILEQYASEKAAYEAQGGSDG